MINITVRHFEITEDLKSFIEDRCGRLIRYFNRIRRIDVILKFAKNNYEVEVIAKGPLRITMVARATDYNLINAIDMAFEKIEKQLDRAKNRIKGHHGKGFKAVLMKSATEKESTGLEQHDWY